jgi:hypothetical protein
LALIRSAISSVLEAFLRQCRKDFAHGVPTRLFSTRRVYTSFREYWKGQAVTASREERLSGLERAYARLAMKVELADF